jgi:hypothetical protein
MPVSAVGLSRLWENVVVPVSVQGDAGDLARKMAQLEGELWRLARPRRWLRRDFVA